MKTIGKTLENDNAIVELSKKDIKMLLTSVNSYCVKLHNLGLKDTWVEYTSLEVKILNLKCNLNEHSTFIPSNSSRGDNPRDENS